MVYDASRSGETFLHFLPDTAMLIYGLMTLDEIARRRFTALLIWSSLALGATYLFIFDPGRTGFFPACPFRTLTGFTCPGCGSTRGLHRLLHGDVVGAFEFNPLMVVALPFLLYALGRYTNAALRGRPFERRLLNVKYIWALLFVIVSFWVYRNTPWYPFPI